MIDEHLAEEFEALRRRLLDVGLNVQSYSPGARAVDRQGRDVHLNEGALQWLDGHVREHLVMKQTYHEARQYLDADDEGRLAMVRRAAEDAAAAEGETRRMRHLLLSALEVRGDTKGRRSVDVLRDVAQWHRASGDTAVADDEADALDRLADQLDGLAKAAR